MVDKLVFVSQLDNQQPFFVPDNRTHQVWNNPNNPIQNNDAARSWVRNQSLDIQIDYEIADLDTITNSSLKRSPMVFYEEPNTVVPSTVVPSFVYSDRYVLLQTYTFHNTDMNTPITNLEFYQFLHSHGANIYTAAVHSCYASNSISDGLQYYVPFDSVHQTGNFRYDITQWNDPKRYPQHVDYAGFSSTREPNWIDNDTFNGHSGRPAEGTHVHIENRQLNNIARLYNQEVGGAMGWDMGTLDPNESITMTIAFLCSHAAPVEAPITLDKTDDVAMGDCRDLDEEITYTINWQNYSDEPAFDAVLVDYLPAGVTYPITYSFDSNFNLISSDPNYNEENHTYTWHLGTIAANSSGSVQLTVAVNEASEPGLELHNSAILSSSLGTAEATEDTLVCCWDTDDGIIYVNAAATGYNNGTDWVNAYTDLQRALMRAAAGCSSVNTIYVAGGMYSPGREAESVFVIPAGVSVYGGYVGEGPNANTRNPKLYQTILSGLGGAQRNETVVQMGNNTLLDGCVVQDSALYGQGILCRDVDSAVIANCIVKNNESYGIYADNSDVEITWSSIRENGYDGIYHSGNSRSIVVENCSIASNQRHGIYIKDSVASFKNNAICNNGISGTSYFGIRCINPKAIPIVYNNTIIYNRNEAFSYADSDPNHVNKPDIQNCILWYNNVDGNKEQFSGWKIRPKYSCVYDPNCPEGLNYSLDPNSNFSGKPGFAYPYNNDPNVAINVHLNWDSYCKDRGNPTHGNGDVGLNDIDKEERILDNRVDIGADEIGCEDIFNVRDWNADGLVNLVEFNIFSKAWLSHDPNDLGLNDPNNPMNDPNSPYYVSQADKERWNPVCNFTSSGDSRHVIDVADLLVFIDADPNSSTNTDRWLWQACWLSEEWQEQVASPPMMMAISQPQQMAATAIPIETQIAEMSAEPIPMEAAVVEVAVPEKSIEEQLAELKGSAKWLEELWKTEVELQNEIDAASWKEFMDAVYENVQELEQLNAQTLSESEELQ